MHSILALGGAHLSYHLQENIEIQQATCRHYSFAVRTLRRISEDETLLREPLVLLRMILTVIILCHYEVVSGNLDGSPFTHLRASRHLLLELRSRRHQINTTAELKLYGFVTELYSYVVLCNTITPFAMNCKRTLVHDKFLQSLDDLRDFGAFGVMFGGGHGLFEMISLISLFAAHKESLPSMGHDTDPERYEIYERFKSRIINWNPPAMDSPENDSDHDLLSGRKAALELCRLVLMIFLETALSPFSKYDSARIYQLQPLLDVAMSYLPLVSPTKFSCIAMWPLMIIGSCLVEEDQRRVMKNILIHNQYMMRNTAQASNLLELLWMDPDEYAIGPYGLGMLMENYELDYGVI
ncbi:hypothetical protein Asppvi_000066 [Aspergillus pseudoviridinutans]|uniref:Fungal-specific transcription factor domain-containing protein n=1 Tax=Aspergillus pseudoviridinutans TaxID=1517512 RepID=A0A9P3B0Q7_9EURO|nr:uncharacterized protein Asppvi_000066 [Aspergillus pseudoviridinutans]GIJ81567.1 hypothetical protein Asppvi_000066 [Aspergillus pseudoviridinutans]